MESDLKRLADALLKRLESERARVAGVLGDEVAPVMTMARYLIEDTAQRLARGEPAQKSQELLEASAAIRDAARKLRQLGSELWPKVLDDLGLLPALSSLIRDFSHQNRAIAVSPRIALAESDIPGELKLAIFRIVQAALSNVARHSKASMVRIFLSSFENELRLGIEDNGVGFDLERLHTARQRIEGCGLGMIQRWAGLSGGRCDIESTPRHGTQLRVFWQVQVLVAERAEAGPEAERDTGLPPAQTPFSDQP
ncbi:MAG TPA: ATP-binding protein [Burkholderiaceae bacterium]|jgi:two-component system NarL family sensor kinase|nr:ATP-binding protein [Burkholderiaceae bacterium]